jgi:hypothetical protein
MASLPILGSESNWGFIEKSFEFVAFMLLKLRRGEGRRS